MNTDFQQLRAYQDQQHGQPAVDVADYMSAPAIRLYPLVRIVQSTLNLWRRFNVHPNLVSQTALFQEECREVMDELRQPQINPDALARELADLLVVSIGLLYASGGTVGDMLDAWQDVAAKNDRKTLTTHEVDEATRKIRRRSYEPTG